MPEDQRLPIAHAGSIPGSHTVEYLTITMLNHELRHSFRSGISRETSTVEEVDQIR